MLSNELEKPGFEIPETKGGYFVWAKLPQQYSDGFKFAIDLYDQQKVAVIPGEHFSDKAKDYISKAKGSIAIFEDSKEKSALLELADYVIEREC